MGKQEGQGTDRGGNRDFSSCPLEQVSLRSGGCPIPGSVRGPVGWGLEPPEIGESVPAYGRRIGSFEVPPSQNSSVISSWWGGMAGQGELQNPLWCFQAGIYPAPHSPSQLWHPARAMAAPSTPQPVLLLCPCPLALLSMESKCQQDVNTGWRELGINSPGYSWHCSPIPSRSVALSLEDSTGETVAVCICPSLVLVVVFQDKLFYVKGPMCREVAGVTHASWLTLSPVGPGSAPCAGAH